MTETKTPTQKGKDLYTELKALGLLEYGAIISRNIVHTIADITIPDFGTKKDFDKCALYELSVVDCVRKTLLNQGKYIAGIPSGYRILLPSENATQVERYMHNADAKLYRAQKLAQSSPITDTTSPSDNQLARIHAKRVALKNGPVL